MKFKLNIDLGNDAMLTCYDVRLALIAVCNKLQREHDGLPARGTEGIIQDANGQTVGRWVFKGAR